MTLADRGQTANGLRTCSAHRWSHSCGGRGGAVLDKDAAAAGRSSSRLFAFSVNSLPVVNYTVHNIGRSY